MAGRAAAVAMALALAALALAAAALAAAAAAAAAVAASAASAAAAAMVGGGGGVPSGWRRLDSVEATGRSGAGGERRSRPARRQEARATRPHPPKRRRAPAAAKRGAEAQREGREERRRGGGSGRQAGWPMGQRREEAATRSAWRGIERCRARLGWVRALGDPLPRQRVEKPRALVIRANREEVAVPARRASEAGRRRQLDEQRLACVRSKSGVGGGSRSSGWLAIDQSRLEEQRAARVRLRSAHGCHARVLTPSAFSYGR